MCWNLNCLDVGRSQGLPQIEMMRVNLFKSVVVFLEKLRNLWVK